MSAPDWRALVEAEGAGWTFLYAEPNGKGCTLKAGPWLAFVGGFHAGKWGMNSQYEYDTPAEAIRAALDYLRAELRARIERDTAALARLGGEP